MKRTLKILLSWLLVVALPLSVVGLATNLALRMPDAYQYQMNSKMVIADFGARGQDEEIAKFIERYMLHREAEFQYQMDSEDEMSLLFTRDEQNTIERLRHFLDISFVISIIALGITVLTYIVLIMGEHLEALRVRFLNSFLVYVLMCIGMVFLAFVPRLCEGLHIFFFAELEETTFLHMMFTPLFVKRIVVLIIIFTMIAMGIVTYLTWKHTKEKQMFWH